MQDVFIILNFPYFPPGLACTSVGLFEPETLTVCY